MLFRSDVEMSVLDKNGAWCHLPGRQKRCRMEQLSMMDPVGGCSKKRLPARFLSIPKVSPFVAKAHCQAATIALFGYRSLPDNICGHEGIYTFAEVSGPFFSQLSPGCFVSIGVVLIHSQDELVFYINVVPFNMYIFT